jgi:hypothetical protein
MGLCVGYQIRLEGHRIAERLAAASSDPDASADLTKSG